MSELLLTGTNANCKSEVAMLEHKCQSRSVCKHTDAINIFQAHLVHEAKATVKGAEALTRHPYHTATTAGPGSFG